jgi:hypothetical protein
MGRAGDEKRRERAAEDRSEMHGFPAVRVTAGQAADAAVASIRTREFGQILIGVRQGGNS